MFKWIEYLVIKKSGLFDPVYYLTNYPDVRIGDVDPLMHYINHGWKEGRNPSKSFSTTFYLERYPDVKLARINPLFHYVRFGVNEGRQYNSEFVNTQMESGRVEWLAIVQGHDAAQPLVSIIIPIYNALAMTQACLDNLCYATDGIDFEVIVIDNASNDGSFEWLKGKKKKLPNLTVGRMSENIGFGPAVNIGLQRSKGEFVVILNNDTLVAPGWLENLLAVMKDDPSVGIVSPVTNYVGHGPQIENQAQDLPAEPTVIAQYAKKISGRSGVYYEPNRLVFFCVLVRRELIDLIGYLDEGYEKGNFEDDDYCLRARMAGYRLAIARNAFVYHHGTATFKLNRISHDHLMEVNRVRFYEKAGRIATSFRQWGTNPSDVEVKVSVILRTKDRPQLLRRALASLANQTRRDFEVVLVNDGGEDVSNLVHSFTPYFPITYVYHERSKGRTAAVNAGLQLAKGPWIGYLDDDDILYPWHFEALLQGAGQSNLSVVYGDSNRALFNSIDDLTPMRLVGTPSWDYNCQELLILNYLPNLSYIHTRELLNKVGPWREELDRLEDFEFLLRLSALSDFCHVNKVTCEYRFYLDSENSIFLSREAYWKALQVVYDLHPVTDEKSLQERQLVYDGLQSQSFQINDLIKDMQASNADLLAVRRDIIRLTTGM
jgi:GT2 family glycosyltransferase